MCGEKACLPCLLHVGVRIFECSGNWCSPHLGHTRMHTVTTTVVIGAAQERLRSAAAAEGDAATSMAAGAALALLSLPDTPPPDGDASSSVLRAHQALTAAAVTAPAGTSSQSIVHRDCAEAGYLAQAGGKRQPEEVQQQQQRQSSVWRAAGVATILSLCLSILSAWWLGTSTAASWLST